MESRRYNSMSDLICKQDALTVIDNVVDEFNRDYDSAGMYGAEKARDAVGEVPAVEAVDVVRCRDCWCHKPGKYRFDICSQTEDDFYCARGEKK